jgi:membrane carboxypeptidase/penicillin-binding protein
VPRGIKLREINAETGGSPSYNHQNSITEAFKEDDEFSEEQKLAEENNNTSKLIGNSSDQTKDNKSILGIY